MDRSLARAATHAAGQKLPAALRSQFRLRRGLEGQLYGAESRLMVGPTRPFADNPHAGRCRLECARG